MKNLNNTKATELTPHTGLRVMRVRAEVSSPGQPGLGGATVLLNGRLSGISAAARTGSAMLESAMTRFNNRCRNQQVPAVVEKARVGWIAGNLHLFTDAELEKPA